MGEKEELRLLPLFLVDQSFSAFCRRVSEFFFFKSQTEQLLFSLKKLRVCHVHVFSFCTEVFSVTFKDKKWIPRSTFHHFSSRVIVREDSRIGV